MPEKVLIIEDDRLSAQMLRDILHAHGYQTMCAHDGREGLELARREEPDVVLLDLVLPGMNGVSICEAVRALETHKRPSIIIVSHRGEKKTIAEALQKGADDFLVKPVDELELLARLRAQTRLIRFHRELEEDKRNLQALLDITRAISATLDTNKVLQILVERVANVTNAVRCSIVLIATDSEGYVLASHDDKSLTNFKINLVRYPEIQEVLKTKSTIVLEDMVNHPLLKPVRDHIRNLVGMSVLVVPIVFHEEVLGTLFLRSRKAGKGFTKKEIDFCQIVANSSYHAIKNAKLFEKIKKEKEHLKEIAIRDSLTMLYNHNFFYTRLEEEFDRAVRYETPLSLIMMDVDDFKRINDTYGHRTGDTVLKEIANIIKKSVRKSDIVARYGGEEFVALLPHTPLSGAVEEAERIRKLIEEHCYAGLLTESVTVSAGVVSYPEKIVMNSVDLVNLADEALYRAKASGKNRIEVV